MPRENTNIKERYRSDLTPPSQYLVLFHNDDFTPMEFVVALLEIIFYKPKSEALTLMLKVHHEGKAVVGIYSYDIAHTKATQATSIARDNGYPLRITVERG